MTIAEIIAALEQWLIDNPDGRRVPVLRCIKILQTMLE